MLISTHCCRLQGICYLCSTSVYYILIFLPIIINDPQSWVSWAQVEQITNHGKYFLKIHTILFRSLESEFCTGFLVFGIFTHLDNLSNISLGTEECRSFVNSWKKQFCMYAKAKSSKIISDGFPGPPIHQHCFSCVFTIHSHYRSPCRLPDPGRAPSMMGAIGWSNCDWWLKVLILWKSLRLT